MIFNYNSTFIFAKEQLSDLYTIIIVNYGMITAKLRFLLVVFSTAVTASWKTNTKRYPDGTVKIVYPDGRQETQYQDGRVCFRLQTFSSSN